MESGYEEDMSLPLAPVELAKHLSKGKAESAAKKCSDSLVIGADTFIILDDHVLGKPHTHEKARETLHALSGRAHKIVTGFTIIDTRSGESVSDAVTTTVHFKTLTDAEIDSYVATGEPLDKAGSYAIQGKGRDLVDRIEGDFDNVVGLPVASVKAALMRLTTAHEI